MSTQSRQYDLARLVDPLLTNEKLLFVQSFLYLGLLWAFVSAYVTAELPPPTAAFEATYALFVSGDWIPHFRVTITRICYSFVFTVVVGTTLGVVTGISDFWRYALQDYITIGMAIPGLFAAVFSAMWFGISNISPMIASMLIAYPYLAQNVFNSVDDVDHGLLEMSSAFGVSRRRVLWRTVTQSMLPGWFAGVRYAFSISWKVTALTELVAASNGIGYMLQYQMTTLSIEGVLKWTLLFMVVILFIEYGVFQQLENRVFSWRDDTSIGVMG